MDHTIKRTITITITETWTIVWASTADPLRQSPVTGNQAPNSEEDVQTVPQATQNNTISNSLSKEQGAENDLNLPQIMDQPSGRKRTSPTRRRRHK